MSLRKNKREVERLIAAFESEASKFHNLTFSTFTTRKDGELLKQKFKTPHHAIMLWQYYGKLGSDYSSEKFVNDLQNSDLKWGIRGAKASSFGIVEGDNCDLFVRMAKRAGSLLAMQSLGK